MILCTHQIGNISFENGNKFLFEDFNLYKMYSTQHLKRRLNYPLLVAINHLHVETCDWNVPHVGQQLAGNYNPNWPAEQGTVIDKSDLSQKYTCNSPPAASN